MAILTTPAPSRAAAQIISTTATLTPAEVEAEYPPSDAVPGTILVVPGAVAAPGDPIPLPTVYVAFSPDGKFTAWVQLAPPAAVIPADMP